MDEAAKRRTARIVIGTLAGAGAVWFLTSRKGAGTRQQIRKLAGQTKDFGMELGHETAEKTRDLIALGREITHDEDWIEAIETLELKPSPGGDSEDEESPDLAPPLRVVPQPDTKREGNEE
ncbi:YtxH domain-containing protein [Saccharibacillus alkalitolerans]|uniref:YtxH domain-containing protein n=1 Tax=Saccharibacillus alkalitolerans TaxID=2705290 RepID=A0ABX0EZ66_9BACL|nr:YtxH domain-containing protein [Saccharibacillus alkalitolerans]NGZ74031.1 YtxH domain-containing protein [Saccharibacillus alkalitolerans]